MSKPKVFIGSSVEGLEIAYAIQENLVYTAEATVWTQGVFNLSESSLESLITILESSDYGIFVFSPDDHIKIRGKRDLAVRDNVLFELGLFVGKLDRKRCFIVIPDNKEFHLPTDLIGMTPAKYEASRSDKNILAGTGSVCNKIREIINKEGKFNITNEAPEDSKNQIPEKKKVTDDWFDYLFIEIDYDKAIALLKKKIRYTKDHEEKIQLKGWLCYSEFKKDPLVGTKEYEKLISENPTNNNSYIAYANNLIWNNAFKQALGIIENGISKCERKITLTNLKAQCLWGINQKKEAIQLLNETLMVNKDITLYTSLADYYLKENDNKSAVNLLHKAYFVFPDNETIKQKLAKAAYDVNEKEICMFLYKDLLASNPNNSTYWCLLGNAYNDLKLENLALSAYEKAAEMSDNKESWIYDNIGNLYNNLNLYDKAEENLKKGLSIYDKSDYNFRRLAAVYNSKEEEAKKVSEIIAKAKVKLNAESLA